MSKFVTVDANGRATAFYDGAINANAIPADAMPIGDDLWRQWFPVSADVVYAPATKLLTAAPPPAPTSAQLVTYVNTKCAARLAVPRAYTLAAGVTIKADSTDSTRSLVIGLNDWGAVNPTATQLWTDDFGAVTSITGAQAVALYAQTQAYIQSVYAIVGAACQAIAAGTITTYAQIDALSWPA